MSREQLEGIVRATFMTFEMLRKNIKQYREVDKELNRSLLRSNIDRYAILIVERNRLQNEVVKSLSFCWHDKYLDYFLQYYKRQTKRSGD